MAGRIGSVGRRVGVGFALALSVGCAQDGESLERVSAGQTAQNTSCALGVECSITALYPSGIPSGSLAIVARDGVSVGAQSEVRGSNGSLGYVATATGQANVQAQAHVGGVWTRGSAFIGSQALVEGKLLTGSPPTVQPTATVGSRGTAQGDPAKATFKVTFPSSPLGDVTVQNSSQRTLEPGRFGTLHVHNGSVAKLRTGVYYFEEVKIESGGKVEVTTTAGTAVVWIRGELLNRGRWTSNGAPSDVLIGSFFKGRVEAGLELDATLLAPGAEVVLASSNTPTIVHNGLYFGRTVELQGSVRVKAVNVSKQGPSYGGLVGEWTPATGVTPPQVPSANGLTYDQYRAQTQAYLTNLLASGYSGPPVQVPAHPDASTVRNLDEFKVPEGDNNPDGASITSGAADAVPDRPSVALGTPKPATRVTISSRGGGGLPTSTNYLNSPHLTAAFSEMEQEVDSAVQQTETELPFIDPASADNGRGVGPAPTFPKECKLSGGTRDSDATVGQIQEQFPTPFHRGIDFGEPPKWINLDAWPDEDARVIDSQVPEFDAYWFMSGYLESGFAADRGLYGEVGVQLGAGGAILGEPIRIVDVKIGAEATMQDKREGRDGGPHLEAQLVAYAAGTTWYKFGRAADPVPSQELFKQNLMEGKYKLLPGDGLEFWVGPFNIEVNAGVEISAPLAINLDVTGPEATFAPMVRAFISVFGGVDFGLKVGLEGEADLLRVDAPFSAKLKWHNRLNPQECAMAADFKATLRIDMTTLNGSLYVVAGISDSLIPGAMYREELVSWPGIKLLSEEINLLDLPFPDVIKYPDALCQFGAQSCAETADADTTFSDFETSHSGFVPVTSSSYGSSACPGQYVVEIPVAGYGGDGIWVQGKWRANDVTSEALCNDSHARIDTWKQLTNGSWQQQPAVLVHGSYSASEGCVQTAEGAQMAPGQSPLFNNPWTFLTTAGVQKVRVAVTTEVDCSTKQLDVRASETRF